MNCTANKATKSPGVPPSRMCRLVVPWSCWRLNINADHPRGARISFVAECCGWYVSWRASFSSHTKPSIEFASTMITHPTWTFKSNTSTSWIFRQSPFAITIITGEQRQLNITFRWCSWGSIYSLLSYRYNWSRDKPAHLWREWPRVSKSVWHFSSQIRQKQKAWIGS